MVNKCQKHKERLLKGANERYQDFSAEEKDERLRKAQERYQIFTREKKNGVSIIRNIKRSYLTIEEIII